MVGNSMLASTQHTVWLSGCEPGRRRRYRDGRVGKKKKQRDVTFKFQRWGFSLYSPSNFVIFGQSLLSLPT